MFSFTAWTLLESISIWLTSYIDILVVGTLLSKHFLGLYNTSITIVGQIMGLVLSATTPVLFSGLSRLQDNDEEFKAVFFKFQKYVSIVLIPLGVGMFCYSRLITELLLGDQWHEADGFVGLWSLTSAFSILLAQYAGEVYRSKGRPKLSFVAQWLHLIVLIPVIIWAAGYGFHFLYVSRSLVRLELMLVNIVILHTIFNIKVWKMMINILPTILSSLVMFIASIILKQYGESLWWDIISAVICSITYLCILCMFSEERNQIKSKVLRIK